MSGFRLGNRWEARGTKSSEKPNYVETNLLDSKRGHNEHEIKHTCSRGKGPKLLPGRAEQVRWEWERKRASQRAHE